ncbi:MAG: hypothetical protein LBV26_02800 [Bacteroidales bacterium]|jgi:hypothetical protein|nr:hypothetical protein [Bacteroidales bacterium]
MKRSTFKVLFYLKRDKKKYRPFSFLTAYHRQIIVRPKRNDNFDTEAYTNNATPKKMARQTPRSRTEL